MPLFKRRQDKKKEEPEPKPEEDKVPEEEKEKAEGEEEAPEGEAPEGEAPEGEAPEGEEPEEGAPEGEEPEEETPEGEEPEEEAPSEEEPGEDSPEEAPPEEDAGAVELTEDAEAPEDLDEGEMSIDELLEAAGTADRPSEMDETVGGLAGEDVQLVKMARKVVVIGDPAVGKTSLIKRFVQDVFDDRYLNTIGAKVMKKELGVNRPDTGEIVDLKLILWDIAGQETFDNVKKAYYRGASGAIVVCDMTRKETMENMHRWIENLFDVSDVVPMVIICNKNDLAEETQFDVEKVEGEYAPYGAPVFSTSAKLGDNVEMVFHELGKMISK
jgi:small GTP-binding protein